VLDRLLGGKIFGNHNWKAKKNGQQSGSGSEPGGKVLGHE
jgi:hypothetical protein